MWLVTLIGGMTLGELRRRMPPSELCLWAGELELRNQQQEEALRKIGQ